MAQLRQEYQEIQNRGAEVVVVGPDIADDFREYWRDHDLPFVGLPDPKHSVLKQYGQEFKILKLGRMPAQMIIDRSRIVRWVHYGHSMKDIPENREILSLLDEINEPTNG